MSNTSSLLSSAAGRALGYNNDAGVRLSADTQSAENRFPSGGKSSTDTSGAAHPDGDAQGTETEHRPDIFLIADKNARAHITIVLTEFLSQEEIAFQDWKYGVTDNRSRNVIISDLKANALDVTDAEFRSFASNFINGKTRHLGGDRYLVPFETTNESHPAGLTDFLIGPGLGMD